MSIEELVLGDSRLVFLGSDLGAGLFRAATRRGSGPVPHGRHPRSST